LKTSNRRGSELLHYCFTAVRYFGVSGSQSKMRGSSSFCSNFIAHCFALIVDDLLAVNYQYARKDLTQVIFNLR